MYYTGSSPEKLYIVVLYLICFDRFKPEAVTVYTHVIYTLHVLHRVWPRRLPYSCIMYWTFYVGSSDRFMSGPSSRSASGQLPSYHICLYSNVVPFLVWIYLQNRGGANLFCCIKAATLQYLGRVVCSVIQAIANKHLELHHQNSHSLNLLKLYTPAV